MQVPPPARPAILATGCYVPTAGCDVPPLSLELQLTVAMSTHGPSPTDTGSSNKGRTRRPCRPTPNGHYLLTPYSGGGW